MVAASEAAQGLADTSETNFGFSAGTGGFWWQHLIKQFDLEISETTPVPIALSNPLLATEIGVLAVMRHKRKA